MRAKWSSRPALISCFSNMKRQRVWLCSQAWNSPVPIYTQYGVPGQGSNRDEASALTMRPPRLHRDCTSDLSGIICSYSSLRGWCARRDDRNPYLQIDLLMPHTITKLATQGAASNWVKEFSLAFSYDNIKWFNYTVNGNLKVGLEVTSGLKDL